MLTKKLNNQNIGIDLFNEEEFDEEPNTTNEVQHSAVINHPTVEAIAEENTTLRHRRTNSQDLNQQNNERGEKESQPDDLIKIDCDTTTNKL